MGKSEVYEASRHFTFLLDSTKGEKVGGNDYRFTFKPQYGFYDDVAGCMIRVKSWYNNFQLSPNASSGVYRIHLDKNFPNNLEQHGGTGGEGNGSTLLALVENQAVFETEGSDPKYQTYGQTVPGKIQDGKFCNWLFPDQNSVVVSIYDFLGSGIVLAAEERFVIELELMTLSAKSCNC